MPKVTLELTGSAPRTLVLLCDGADDPGESISSQEPTPHILGRAEEVGDPGRQGLQTLQSGRQATLSEFLSTFFLPGVNVTRRLGLSARVLI